MAVQRFQLLSAPIGPSQNTIKPDLSQSWGIPGGGAAAATGANCSAAKAPAPTITLAKARLR